MRRAAVSVPLVLLLTCLSGCGGGGGGGGGDGGEGGADGGGTPPAKNWAMPADLATHLSVDGPDAWSPKVAMDGHGNAVVVWYQEDAAGHSAVYLSEYRDGTWKHPASLADHVSLAGQDAGYPSVAMSENGDAIVVWRQEDGVDAKIYKSEYRNGAWKHPVAFSDCFDIPGGTNAQDPAVAMDGQGNTIVVWALKDVDRNHLYKAEYRGGAWVLPAGMDERMDPNGLDASSPAVAMDDLGNALVTWSESVGGTYRIFKSDYRGGEWFHPANTGDAISPPGGSNAYRPTVTMDGQGEALIAWYQFVDASSSRVFLSEYRGGRWTHPADLSDSISAGNGGVMVRAAMDAAGNAILVWADETAASSAIYRATYRGGSWTFPADLADQVNLPGNAIAPNVAMDRAGDAIVVWRQNDGTTGHLFKSEYRNGAWTAPSGPTDHVSPAGAHVDTIAAELAMSSDGTALIVWAQGAPANLQVFSGHYR